MQLLDAINLMLEAVGEHPVTAADTRHPTVAKARTILVQQRQQILSQGYWFNTFPATLTPDILGEIGIPSDTLALTPMENIRVAIRGDKLYNGENLSFKFDSAVVCEVFKDIEYEDLPISARIAIANKSAIQLYSVDIGVDANAAIYEQNAKLAMAQLDAEHVRQRKFTARSRASWGRLQRARRV